MPLAILMPAFGANPERGFSAWWPLLAFAMPEKKVAGGFPFDF